MPAADKRYGTKLSPPDILTNERLSVFYSGAQGRRHRLLSATWKARFKTFPISAELSHGCPPAALSARILGKVISGADKNLSCAAASPKNSIKHDVPSRF